MVPQLIWNTTILRWPVTVGLGTALVDMIFVRQHSGGHDLSRYDGRITTPSEWTGQAATCHETDVAVSRGMCHFEATDCVSGLLART